MICYHVRGTCYHKLIKRRGVRRAQCGDLNEEERPDVFKVAESPGDLVPCSECYPIEYLRYRIEQRGE